MGRLGRGPGAGASVGCREAGRGEETDHAGEEAGLLGRLGCQGGRTGIAARSACNCGARRSLGRGIT